VYVCITPFVFNITSNTRTYPVPTK